MIEVEPSPEIVAYEDHDMIEPQELPTMDISQKRKHAWVREIIQEEETYGATKRCYREKFQWIGVPQQTT